MAASTDDYRAVMRRLPTGVSVLTIRAGEVVHGMTANTVTSISLDPLLILISVDRTARAHELLISAGEFTVNVLGASQAHLSRRFAVRDMADSERWEGVRTEPATTIDAPRIVNCTGYLECRTRELLDGGDHTIFLADVVEAEPGHDSPPLVFWQRSYRTVTPDAWPLHAIED